MDNQQEYSINLLEIARVLWKNILIIALVAVLVGGLAFGYTAFMVDPQYEATASLYVNNSNFSLGNTNISISSSDLNASSSLVSVYLYILDSRATMEEVIKEAELAYTPEELRKMISSEGISNTGAFEVTVTSTIPAETELIANTIAKILPDRISEIVDGTSVRIVDYAIIPASRSSPNIIKNTAIGILAGGFLSAGWVALRSLMDDRSKVMIASADDLHKLYPNIMVLASVPDMRMSEKKNGYYSSYYGDAAGKKKGGKGSGRRQGS